MQRNSAGQGPRILDMDCRCIAAPPRPLRELDLVQPFGQEYVQNTSSAQTRWREGIHINNIEENLRRSWRDQKVSQHLDP